MQNINSVGTNHGVRHAYAYGHARKNNDMNFKELLSNSEDKSETAKEFKNLITQTETKPETQET